MQQIQENFQMHQIFDSIAVLYNHIILHAQTY